MAPVGGLSSPAQVERIVDIGGGRRVYLRLLDGQVVVAQLAGEDIKGMTPGSLSPSISGRPRSSPPRVRR
ncbi:MAG: hypothetical protein ACR2MC_08975 [Actinomycetota bacterium]